MTGAEVLEYLETTADALESGDVRLSPSGFAELVDSVRRMVEPVARRVPQTPSTGVGAIFGACPDDEQ